eukprot:758112-Hanusia_phi.AAC.1
MPVAEALYRHDQCGPQGQGGDDNVDASLLPDVRAIVAVAACHVGQGSACLSELKLSLGEVSAIGGDDSVDVRLRVPSSLPEPGSARFEASCYFLMPPHVGQD